MRAGAEPRLPVLAPRRAYLADTGWITEALLGAHGIGATVLRALEPPTTTAGSLLLCEPRGPVPPGWRARPPEELHDPGWVVAGLTEALASDPPERPAYQRCGWRDEAEAWTAAALAGAGRRLLELAPLRSWGVSSLWRAHAEGGDAFLKAVPPVFRAEPELTRWLGTRFPGAVPASLAVDPARGLLLLDAVPGDGVPAESPAALARIAARIACLQVAAAGDLAPLRAAGAPDRAASFAADLEAAMQAAAGGLGAAERARLPDLAGRLEARRRRLEALALPPTLVHGDLHPGNALLLPDRVVLLDWSDPAVAPPWVDLFTLFTQVGWERFGEARHGAALDAWGGAWGLEPPALRAALPDLLTLGAAYHLVSYHLIRAGQEPTARWELGDVPLRLLRRLLEGAWDG